MLYVLNVGKGYMAWFSDERYIKKPITLLDSINYIYLFKLLIQQEWVGGANTIIWVTHIQFITKKKVKKIWNTNNNERKNK